MQRRLYKVAALQHTLLQLNNISGVGPALIQRLLQCYGADMPALCQVSIGELVARGFSQQSAQRIITGLADKDWLQQELDRIEAQGVKVITLYDDSYPELLRTIHYPPPLLYVQGMLPTFTTKNRTVAVVGSRNANAYGIAVTRAYGAALVQQGYIVVSGGARGIDMYAHRAALEAGRPTVVILGSGLLKPYPLEHTKMFAEIVAVGGTIMSPFPLMMAPMPGNFPARNRIIAGCASACIVVQASEKSGALITASYALQEGRDVGIVPGSIFDPLSKGCHTLLAQGATPLASIDELYQFMGCSVIPPQETVQQLSAQEQIGEQLHRICVQPHTLDELLQKTGMTSDMLYDHLWDLQVKGLIEQTVTGRWRSC